MPVPLRVVRIHCQPYTGTPGKAYRTMLYSCDQAVPGFVRRASAWDVDFVRLTHDNPGGLTTVDHVGSTNSTRVKINKSSGGVVNELAHSATTDPASGTNFINHWDLVGRSLQTAHFINVDGAGTLNPTQGGGFYGNQTPQAERAQSTGYTDTDVVQGAPLIEYSEVEHDDGSKTIRAFARPLDFQSDSTHPAVAHYTGHDAFIFPQLLQGFDLTLGIGGLEGTHRFDSYLYASEDLGPNVHGQFGHFGCALRHGFDKLYVWNERNTSGILLNTTNIVTGLDLSPSAYAENGGSSFNVTITTGAHGRALNTFHIITLDGTSSNDIDGSYMAWFDTATTCRITVVGFTASTGGTLTSVTVAYNNVDQSNIRQMWVGQTNVQTLAIDATDPGGFYPGLSQFDEAGIHALIWRADNSESWSLAADFCVAFVSVVTGYVAGGAAINLAQWRSTAGAVSNAADADELQHTSFAEFWLADGFQIPKGWRAWNGYIVCGTFAEVKARLAVLAGLIAVAEPVSPKPPVGGTGSVGVGGTTGFSTPQNVVAGSGTFSGFTDTTSFPQAPAGSE